MILRTDIFAGCARVLTTTSPRDVKTERTENDSSSRFHNFSGFLFGSHSPFSKVPELLNRRGVHFAATREPTKRNPAIIPNQLTHQTDNSKSSRDVHL